MAEPAFKSVFEMMAEEEAARAERVRDEVRPLLEAATHVATADDAPLLSIAISLKRIADALNYNEKESNLYDLINDIRHNTRSSP